MNYASVAFVTSEIRQNWRERRPDTNGLENWIWWPEVTMQKIFLSCWHSSERDWGKQCTNRQDGLNLALNAGWNWFFDAQCYPYPWRFLLPDH